MSSFALDLSRFRIKTEERASQVVRKIALELFTLIVTRSPVDTGRFRANNQISLNSLPGDAVLKFDKTGSVTISSGGARLGQYKLGDTIFLYNNVEYGLALEYGRSQQAPQGVYRLSVSDVMLHMQMGVGE